MDDKVFKETLEKNKTCMECLYKLLASDTTADQEAIVLDAIAAISYVEDGYEYLYQEVGGEG